MAGAMAVIAPLAGSKITLAQDSTPPDGGTVRIKSDPASQGPSEAGTYAVAAREDSLEQSATDQLTQGQSIADFALSYVGYPYAAGGNSVYGFDCSGFTQFVYINMLGIDIGHAVESQPWSGYLVDWEAWIPGDLIVFQNTYRAGISHVGIYIGNGQIVHAENEATGVTISSIYSDYYIARYWGAIRLI
jgi:cell wall-associated NlpC family hydrolase